MHYFGQLTTKLLITCLFIGLRIIVYLSHTQNWNQTNNHWPMRWLICPLVHWVYAKCPIHDWFLDTYKLPLVWTNMECVYAVIQWEGWSGCWWFGSGPGSGLQAAERRIGKHRFYFFLLLMHRKNHNSGNLWNLQWKSQYTGRERNSELYTLWKCLSYMT